MDDTTNIAYAVCQVADIPNRRARAFSLIRLEPGAAEGDPPVETPFHILILRWDRKIYGYVNRCPHHGVNLDWERNQFFDAGGTRLICGKHGALFDIETGVCVEGPCRGQQLEPVRLSILAGDICVILVNLVEA